jgi:hypothetical protein
MPPTLPTDRPDDGADFRPVGGDRNHIFVSQLRKVAISINCAKAFSQEREKWPVKC